MAQVVLMEQCNFVSASAETIDYRSNGISHFIDNLSRGSALILLERASWSAVKKLDSQTYNWRFLLLDIAFGGGCRCSKKVSRQKT